MSNYLVITYNEKKPMYIESMYYIENEEDIKYVLELQKQSNIKYKIYKELFSKVQE